METNHIDQKKIDITEMLVPPEGTRCTDVFGDILKGYAGIQEADFDIDTAGLRLQFDPRIISPEMALHVVNTAGRQAGARVATCASKSANGQAACASCVAKMNLGLAEHYKKLANIELEQTELDEGTIRVRLKNLAVPEGTPTLVSMEGILPEKQSAAEAEQAKITSKFQISRRQLEVFFTIGNAVFTGLGFLGTALSLSSTAISIIYLAAYILGGVFGLIDGLHAVRTERKLDVNLLMILAALGAAIIGQPLEGAILLFLFSLSNTLQTFALERNRIAIEKLLDLRPPMATVRRGSRLVSLAIEKVMVGDVVIVRPGERIPVDGVITQGASDINQAVITGESVPVHRKEGETVFASTVNGMGSLEVRTMRLAQDSTLARIVQMVEHAQASKAHTQTTLDQFEQVYAWFVLGGAIFLALVPLLWGQPFHQVFYRAMTWLVVASPCALVISTPASILSAIANGARNGVLFKGGIHLEKTAGLKVVAFDKTGTLTTGKPTLQSLHPFGGLTEFEFLQKIASLEARSEHPVGKAIVQAAQARGISLLEATEFRAIAGQGVEGHVSGHLIWVGNERMFAERGVSIPADVHARMNEAEIAGQTAMVASSDGQWLGVLGVADTIRPDALDIIRRLKAAGIQRIVMLTGDNEKVAQAIALKAGVDEFHAGLLPQDKVQLIETLRHNYGEVAMVGDGVNDAPALATADVGIAMGGAGSDVALETADIVLMADDLTNLPHAIRLAKHARQVIIQNLTFALAVIVLLVVSAFGLALPLPLGVVGHEGSTVLVVLNGLRLLTYKKA